MGLVRMTFELVYAMGSSWSFQVHHIHAWSCISQYTCINTSYATLSNDIQWTIPRVSCIFSVYLRASL